MHTLHPSYYQGLILKPPCSYLAVSPHWHIHVDDLKPSERPQGTSAKQMGDEVGDNGMACWRVLILTLCLTHSHACAVCARLHAHTWRSAHQPFEELSGISVVVQLRLILPEHLLPGCRRCVPCRISAWRRLGVRLVGSFCMGGGGGSRGPSDAPGWLLLAQVAMAHGRHAHASSFPSSVQAMAHGSCHRSMRGGLDLLSVASFAA